MDDMVGRSTSDIRNESRRMDELRGPGCSWCAHGSWFDEAVDFGWWCLERDDFIGGQICCSHFVKRTDLQFESVDEGSTSKTPITETPHQSRTVDWDRAKTIMTTVVVIILVALCWIADGLNGFFNSATAPYGF